MKQTSLIIALAATVVLTACGGGQKPSKRDNVWGENVDTSVVAKNQVKGEKVLVPFKRIDNDLLEVQVSLNGVPFNMYWDTGASVTCISLFELQKLAKEGKISMDDYQGPAFSKIADGSTTESAVFTIKEIYIQGRDNKYIVVKDVEALVTPNQEAPLLLGQNVIKRLPKHALDESNGVIEFEKQP